MPRSWSVVARLGFAFSLTASGALAQSQSAVEDSADAAFARQDWTRAADAYARVTSQSPANGRAWFRLGLARQSLKQYDRARTAFANPAAATFQPLGVQLRLARISAMTGRADSAFAHLSRAEAIGFAPQVIATEPDFEAIRTDPRFAALLARRTAARYPCRTQAESRQFDFWIGDWNVNPWASPSAPPAAMGVNKVTLMLESCMLFEEWTGAGGSGAGKSVNFWDTNRRKWRQIWIADGGSSLDYAGEFSNGAMRFEGWTANPNGQRVLQKLTFFPISPDTVRQLFETSTDSGRTWVPGFDGRYVRKK